MFPQGRHPVRLYPFLLWHRSPGCNREITLTSLSLPEPLVVVFFFNNLRAKCAIFIELILSFFDNWARNLPKAVEKRDRERYGGGNIV